MYIIYGIQWIFGTILNFVVTEILHPKMFNSAHILVILGEILVVSHKVVDLLGIIHCWKF